MLRILTLALPLFLAPEAVPLTLDSLAWLEGDWVRQTRRGLAVETWSQVGSHTMEGTATVEVDGVPRPTEYMRLEIFGDEIFLVAKPVQNEFPTGFLLVASTDTEWTFSNPNHDFPQKITYVRVGEDELLVQIEGPMDGEVRTVDFRFTRRP